MPCLLRGLDRHSPQPFFSHLYLCGCISSRKLLVGTAAVDIINKFAAVLFWKFAVFVSENSLILHVIGYLMTPYAYVRNQHLTLWDKNWLSVIFRQAQLRTISTCCKAYRDQITSPNWSDLKNKCITCSQSSKMLNIYVKSLFLNRLGIIQCLWCI